MTSNINQILLFEKPLFSWYQLSLPFEKGLDLPTESCFAYIIEGKNQDLTDSGFAAKKGTVILSLCGKTVGNSLSKRETGFLSTIIVHFDRDVLKEIVLLLLQTQESSNLNEIARSLFSDRTFSFEEVIQANLYEPLHLNRLAAMTNNSLASFKRKFKKIYNDSPANYIRQKNGLSTSIKSQGKILKSM